MWKDIETLKETVIDILPKNQDEAMKFAKVLSKVEKKLGMNTAKMKDLAEALQQLIKEDRITYDDDMAYYLKI